MRIAILGATSQIARDLVLSFTRAGRKEELHLFARRPEAVHGWLSDVGCSTRFPIADFSDFGSVEYGAILNFIGVGSPDKMVTMGATIFDVTLKYDEMALDYVRHHSTCRYLFLSSGAVYGSTFDVPVNRDTKASIAINNCQPQDWYAAAKLHAECRHRSLLQLPIVDIRLFNYFSSTQDKSARFLTSDILRAIVSKETLITAPDNIVRDYIGPIDFYQLVSLILAAPATNDVVDCYTKAPVDKFLLLEEVKNKFRLDYKINDNNVGINATGVKRNYYSENRNAERFGYEPRHTAIETVLNELALAVSANFPV